MIEDDERMPAGWPLDDASAEAVPDASPYVPTVGDLLDAIKEGRLTRDMPLILDVSHTSPYGDPDLAFTLFNVAYLRTDEKNGLVISVQSRELTNAELYGEEQEEPATATDAHANEVSDAIIRAYRGNCPECSEPVSNTVQPGDSCPCCDHVFYLPATTTDEHEEE